VIKCSPDFLSIANFSRLSFATGTHFWRIFYTRKYFSRFDTELLGFAGSVYLPFLQANRQSLSAGIKLCILHTKQYQIYEKFIWKVIRNYYFIYGLRPPLSYIAEISEIFVCDSRYSCKCLGRDFSRKSWLNPVVFCSILKLKHSPLRFQKSFKFIFHPENSV
jgi:hypothetical protein